MSCSPLTILNPARFPEHGAVGVHVRMAHKIRVPLYRRSVNCSTPRVRPIRYTVSTALHENTSFDGFVLRPVRRASRCSTPGVLHGFLSDTAVFNHRSIAPTSRRSSRGAAREQHDGERRDGAGLRGDHDLASPPEGSSTARRHRHHLCDRLPARSRAAYRLAARDIAHEQYGWEQLWRSCARSSEPNSGLVN